MKEIIQNLLQRASETKEFDEAIKKTGIKNPDCYSLIHRLIEMSVNYSKSKPGGYRYDDTLKKFASYIYMIAGRMAYETLSANLPLPSLPSISRYVLKKGPTINEGELRIAELKTYLSERNYPLQIWISEDATRITEKVQYDPRSNQLVGLVLPLDINGMPIRNTFMATSGNMIEQHMKNQPAALVYSIMAQPLCKNASPFCLCIFTTDNKFTANNIVARWNFIIKKCREEDIEILGFSSDGDTRLLKGMKMRSQLGVQTEVEQKKVKSNKLEESNSELPQTWPWFNCDIAVRENFVQDAVHIGVKLRNRLCKFSIKLPIGNKQISLDHLKILIHKESKDKHKLTTSDFDGKDRMNFSSVEKICKNDVIKLLEKSVPESQGTCLYLRIINWSIYSYTDQNLTPFERVYRIWYAVFVLRIWRSWIIKSKEYTLKNNFITLNCYTCIEINAHSLIKIIIQLRDLNREELFLPHFFNSQTCESFFRQIRSMSSTYSTVVNCSMLEILHRLRRIQLQTDIITEESDKIIFPRFENKKDSVNKHQTLPLPMNVNIFQAVTSALAAAINDVKQLGISDETTFQDVGCSVTKVFQSDIQNYDSDSKSDAEDVEDSENLLKNEDFDDDFDENEASYLKKDMTKLESVSGELQLKAYENTKTKLSETSPYTIITDGKGKEIIVRKSTICWLLSKHKGKLSSDRIQRVQQKTLSSLRKINSDENFETNLIKKRKSLKKKNKNNKTTKETLKEIETFSSSSGSKISVGNYVVIEFATKKSIRHFVGLVIDSQEDECEIKFLKYLGHSTFSYPEIDDISHVEWDQIKSVLSQPTIDKRLRYYFNENLSVFNFV